MCQRLVNFYQSGKILPNQVTLDKALLHYKDTLCQIHNNEQNV